jgi:hypothetical protein
MIKLLDLQNGKVVPTEHCHTLAFLKDIMDAYPENHIPIYGYLFYMTCPNDELNPFFNMPADDKEEMILKELNADFSTEDDLIHRALEMCEKLYETPTVRAYRGISNMLDRLGIYMEKTPISHGRDGNINSLVSAAKNFEGIRNSFKGVYKDLKEEQNARTRGGGELAYDQK